MKPLWDGLKRSMGAVVAEYTAGKRKSDSDLWYRFTGNMSSRKHYGAVPQMSCSQDVFAENLLALPRRCRGRPHRDMVPPEPAARYPAANCRR